MANLDKKSISQDNVKDKVIEDGSKNISSVNNLLEDLASAIKVSTERIKDMKNDTNQISEKGYKILGSRII